MLKDVSGRSRNKTVKLRLGDVPVFIEALGLNCTQGSVKQFCDDVDSNVWAWALWPFIPEPDLFDIEGPDGILSEPPFGKSFELLSS
jgi:hypothetical protein